MKGSAPKSSVIGSQVSVKKKCKPNLCLGSAEFIHSSHTTAAVISTTLAAKTSVISRAISSPLRILSKNAREPDAGPAPFKVVLAVATVPDVLLDFAEGLHFLRCDFLRQSCVRQCFRFVLPVGHHPLQKILDGLALCGVLNLLRYQQPREAGNRVCVL